MKIEVTREALRHREQPVEPWFLRAFVSLWFNSGRRRGMQPARLHDRHAEWKTGGHRRGSRMTASGFRVASCFLWPFLLSALTAAAAPVVLPSAASPRVRYAAERLIEALSPIRGTPEVVLGRTDSESVRKLIVDGRLRLPDAPLAAEGFLLASLPSGGVAVVGADDSGVLYGALELARRIRAAGAVPSDLRFSDAPALRLRGPCIGMQKTYILPDRKVYEYPYTPELFPFFYDKAFWAEYLDYLVEHRMNTLYLWNGHPFASLVKLEEYPYALEVSEEVFARNVEMMRYITEEADKRGIWLVQMFYNIILSKPFAERHGLSTQLAAIDPVAADYTRKSIAEFVRQYPNVGLLVCLGEALQDVPQQATWCTEVILAGVKDGMRAAGLTEEPPVVIRAHATDESVVMPRALQVYRNLYTMAKFNGESLTTWEPRGVWQQRHLAMSRLGSTHVVNVHILANLEPFRYGATRFIQRSVQASRDRLGAGGLHVYPLAYWSWPDTPDRLNGTTERSTGVLSVGLKTVEGTPMPHSQTMGETPMLHEPRLKQLDRDWIWFEAWARYAWAPDIDEATDRAYWIDRLAERYGSREAAAHILDAYNDSGECAPRILRRFGITEGNRQTMSLGMTLEQLVDPERYRPYEELWKSQAPPGERLQEYVNREQRGEPHEGETPPQIVDEILHYSARAVAAIEAAAPHVTKNHDEFERLRNDVHCIRATSQNYAEKAYAALAVLRHRHTGELSELKAAEQHLAASLEHFRTLARLTETTYWFANTMQTSQRRIPVTGGIDGKPANYHWRHLLPVYEQELADFRSNLANMRGSGPVTATASGWGASKDSPLELRAASIRVLSRQAETYTVQTGSRVFTDRPYEIQILASALNGLGGIRFSDSEARLGRYQPVEFEADEAVRVLIGYVRRGGEGWLRVPELETDALAAERGGTEPLIRDAAVVDELGVIDVYEVPFAPGRHRLEVRGRGSFVVLGVVKK
jgi:hypothetical protein